MRQIKHYSQRMYLFFFYGCFILLLICIFFAYFYMSYSKNIFTDSKKHLENLCASVSNSVQGELNNISTISMNIAYSNMIRSNFKNFSYAYQNDTPSQDNYTVSRDSALAIYDTITAIIGPFQSASQVNLYTLKGDCVGSGYFQRTLHIDLNDMSWYQPTMVLHGGKYISAPEYKPTIPARGENQNSQMFMSLTRQFNNPAGLPDGFIEVIQDCNNFFSLADQLIERNPTTQIHIFNDRKELIYPYKDTIGNDDEYLYTIHHSAIQPLDSKMFQIGNNRKELLTYQLLNDYDWTIIVTNPEEAVYASLLNFKYIFIGIALLTILITLGLCFVISNNLTKPLRKLTAAANKITINRVLDENKTVIPLADSRITEISELCESIREMYNKLRNSSQKILLSQSQETRAKLQASQSLINPHFLYNSLTTIGVMAEENMNDEIIFLCHSLCDYYRYISESKEMIVPLSEEIFYTEKYIDCMRMRFGENLNYSCHISEDTKSILIPKLILQPIVENAFKYGFQAEPPFNLSIHSYISSRNWILEIEDNGGLLDNNKKEELMKLYQNLNRNEELKSLKIGGMGLKNIYLRIQLLYGSSAIFKIDNSLPNRTIFILGGPIYHSMEEYYEHYTKL